MKKLLYSLPLISLLFPAAAFAAPFLRGDRMMPRGGMMPYAPQPTSHMSALFLGIHALFLILVFIILVLFAVYLWKKIQEVDEHRARHLRHDHEDDLRERKGKEKE